jgi:hypothetical protein
VTITGTWSATLVVEMAADNGVTWVSAGTGPSANGQTTYTLTAQTDFRVRCSAFTSGTVGVFINVATPTIVNLGPVTNTGGGASFVASLPATCTPGVTANVQGSVAINGYIAGTQFYCSATNTWSPDSSGITAGVFTLAQQNDPFTFSLTGGGSQTAGSILNFGGTQTFKLTDGIASVVNIPTSGVTNGFTNAIGAYCWNPNGNTTGQFGWVGCVGVFTQSVAAASGARVWGLNIGAADLAAQTGNFVYGNEYDLQINNNTTQGAGTLYSFRGNGQPTGNNFPALTVQAPAGTGTFTSGLSCQNGAISNTNLFDCITIGQKAAGVSQNSQGISIYASDASSSFRTAISSDKDHIMFIGGVPLQLYQQAASESMGIALSLTPTATLTANQLVKIDTAHADSVVVCTTVDTVCHGFVASSIASPANCIITGTVCGIIAGSGALAKGILGTGTCAIGNFVIVDTTTNGRVKCTASQPAVGATIGLALSVQASVGSLVDILTKFQ